MTNNNLTPAAKTAIQSVENRPRRIWKPFPELESLYEISNDGKVRDANTLSPVRTRLNKGFEVLAVGKRVDGKLYRPAIHRAVALAFVPNPNGYQWARAIDNKKPLALASNLQWVEKHFVKRGVRLRSLADSDTSVGQAYTSYLLDRLVQENRLTKEECSRAGIVAAIDDSMSPTIYEGVEFVATPVSPAHYASLVGKVVAVVLKAKLFTYYLGRIVSIDDNCVCVHRDNSEWSERVENRSAIASIARVVSILESPVY